MSENNEISILEFSEDISKAEAPPPLPKRQYPATVESVAPKTSSTTGNDYIQVLFRISADDFPPDFDAEGMENGVLLPYNRLTIEDTAVGRHRMRQFCEALGAKMSKKIDPTEWIGLSALLDVDHNTYEGVTRAQIKAVKAQ